MPKGVEHSGSVSVAVTASGVIHSLMPKGVEHLGAVSFGEFVEEGDSFIDAERR